MRATNQGFRVHSAGDKAEIYLYDVIGSDFFGGITAKQFAEELGRIKGAKSIDVRINSPGGDVFDGNTIFTLLRSSGAKVNVFVDGLAASIASVIAMAGDSIEISANGMMMIHDPFGLSFGTAEEHRELAGLLDKIKDTIADTYVSRTKLEKDAVLQMMAKETWFTSQEAVDQGFADSVGAQLSVAACVRSDLFKFKNMPQDFGQEPTPEQRESVLELLEQRITQKRTEWREENDHAC